jgi:predicted nucleotidyltransferase
MENIIRETILGHYPEAQAIYIYGSYASGDARQDSDVDIGLLLPSTQAKQISALDLADCRFALEEALGKTVDLLNLRRVSTVLQKEVTCKGRLIHNAAPYAVAEFEMLTLSYYQKLNEERRDILAEFFRSKQAYPVSFVINDVEEIIKDYADFAD